MTTVRVRVTFAALVCFATFAEVRAESTDRSGEICPDLLDELPRPHRADRRHPLHGPAVAA